MSLIIHIVYRLSLDERWKTSHCDPICLCKSVGKKLRLTLCKKKWIISHINVFILQRTFFKSGVRMISDFGLLHWTENISEKNSPLLLCFCHFLFLFCILFYIFAHRCLHGIYFILCKEFLQARTSPIPHILSFAMTATAVGVLLQ